MSMGKQLNLADEMLLDFPLRELKRFERGATVNLKFIEEKKLKDRLTDYQCLTARLCNLAHKDMLTSALPLGFMSLDFAMHEVQRDLNTSLSLAFFHNQQTSDINSLKCKVAGNYDPPVAANFDPPKSKRYPV